MRGTASEGEGTEHLVGIGRKSAWLEKTEMDK